ncbi:MAG: hypothetical protein LBU07_04785 [Coriobacteriales bacterium]|jgi:hypothetical protein|nr:hypothetical protein [Coriobacteriales bacterium]
MKGYFPSAEVLPPVINWHELQKFAFPFPVPGSISKPDSPDKDIVSEKNVWDRESDMYNQMTAMEMDYTHNKIALLNLLPTDHVLNIGFGPGRITRVVAPLVARVTAIDSAKNAGSLSP